MNKKEIKWQTNLYKTGIICLLWVFMPVFCFSQLLGKLPFHHLNRQHGLSDDGYNMFIRKDSRGYVWISSLEEGAYLFNGLNVRTFPGYDTLNIQSDFFEDKAGNVWFTSVDLLHCYLRKKAMIEDYKLEANELGLHGLHLFHLQKTKELAWIIADSSVILFDLKKKETVSLLFTTPAARLTVDTTSSGEVKRIYACPWIYKPGVEIWEPDSAKWLLRPQPPVYPNIGSLPGIVQAIVENDSMAWLLSTNGLFLLNVNNPEDCSIISAEKFPSVSCVRGVIIDQNQMVIATQNLGLLAVDRKQKIITSRWRHQKENEDSPASNVVIGVHYDDEGRLWAAHLNEGVDYSKPPPKAFTPLPVINDPVKHILEDQEGQI
jgi:hypothetical protein